MENLKNRQIRKDDEKSFQIKDYLLTCILNWKWFAISVIICVGLGVLYTVTRIPTYSRTMQLLIQDSSGVGSMDISNSFKDFGLGGVSTNVYNEIVSLKSPAVMQEVVRRLNLTVSIFERKMPHDLALYGSTAPFEVKYETPKKYAGIKMEMTLEPDGSFVISKVSGVPVGAKKRDSFSGLSIKGKIGQGPVRTPVGDFTIGNNGLYSKTRDESCDYLITVSGEHSAIESYEAKLAGDLTDADSEVIDLTLVDDNKERATDVLDAIVDVYNEFWVRDKNRMAIATADFINERLVSLNKELGEADNEVADFQSKNLIPDPTATARLYLDQNAEFDRSIVDVNNSLAMARYTKEFINNPANYGKVIPVLTGAGNTGLENMVKEYNTVLLARENLIENSGADNPVVKQYTVQAEGLRDALIKSVNNYIGTLESSQRNLQSAQNISQRELSTAPRQNMELGAIERNREVKEQLYLYLLQKLEETNLSQTFNAYNTRIITPPFGSDKPISPKMKVNVIVTFILGMLIPAVIYYIKMALSNTIQNRKEVEVLSVPFVGEIPQVGKKAGIKKWVKSKKKIQQEIDIPRPIVEAGKRDVANEAFRVVRSNIELMLGRKQDHNVIAVTSFNPGSGKSFVVYNLGASFALKNKKALLIDGDLRHGSLSRYINSPSKGLTDYLSGEITNARDIVYPVPSLSNLWIAPIGKRPPNPAELLESDMLGKFLDSLREEFDVLLIDCPPVNIVVDTQLINRYADATLFIVRAGLLKRSAIGDLENMFQEKKLNRMSLILNGTDSTQSSYHTYGNYQSLEE